VPRDQRLVATETDYNRRPFVSAIWHENVFATQFHPEKESRAVGLEMLRRFASGGKISP